MSLNFEKKSVSELRNVVANYMRNVVNGDDFINEQQFEDEVRDMLEAAGFIIQDKHDVENAIREINERQVSGTVFEKVPDITVECREGLVFLELKFRNTEKMYRSDIDKVNKYRKLPECAAAGVLFLDEGYRYGWLKCLKNPKYYYYWDLR